MHIGCGYIQIHKNKNDGETLSKTFAKGGKVQWKTIKKEAIHDHYASNLDVQGFAQIAIDNNKFKSSVEMLSLKSKMMSILDEFGEIFNLKL